MIPIKFKGSEKETVHELYYKLLNVSNQKDKKGYITHIKSINAWCLNNICINGHSFTFPEIIKADYDTLCEIAQKYGKGMPEMSDQDKKFMIEYLYNQRFSVIRKEFSDKLEMKVCPYCNRNFVNWQATERCVIWIIFLTKKNILSWLFPCIISCRYAIHAIM